MDFASCLADPALTAKQKSKALSQGLLANPKAADRLVAVAKKANDVDRATCLEAFEAATREHVAIGTWRVFDFAVSALASCAPRVLWEAAKVITNIVQQHGKRVEKALPALLPLAEHEGTVVRWSAARALGAILMLGTDCNAELVPIVEALAAKERDNAVRNHYRKALQRWTKTR